MRNKNPDLLKTDEEKLLRIIERHEEKYEGISNKTLAEALASDWKKPSEKKKFFGIRERLVKKGYAVAVRGGPVGKTALVRGKIKTRKEKADLYLSRDALKLLKTLPLEGMLGNRTIMAQTGLEKESYWKARNELINEGLVIVGTGYGGSSGLSKIGLNERKKRLKKEKKVAKIRTDLLATRETELYVPLNDFFDEEAGDYRGEGETFLVEKTAQMRRRGQWTNPDFVIVTVKKFPLLPAAVFTVKTIEVKRFGEATQLKSVYEAGAHSRYGHVAYLAYEWPKGAPEDGFETIRIEAERYNVGLIRMVPLRKNKYEITYEADPDRREPDPDTCNQFLQRVLSSKNAEILRKALGKELDLRIKTD